MKKNLVVLMSVIIIPGARAFAQDTPQHTRQTIVTSRSNIRHQATEAGANTAVVSKTATKGNRDTSKNAPSKSFVLLHILEKTGTKNQLAPNGDKK